MNYYYYDDDDDHNNNYVLKCCHHQHQHYHDPAIHACQVPKQESTGNPKAPDQNSQTLNTLKPETLKHKSPQPEGQEP